MHNWQKLILFASIVVLPALLVGVSNFNVFPDAALVATGMLLITVIVSGVFTFASNNATPKIVRYCVIADVVICVILCFNLGGHWLLAREVSAAKQATTDRHAEEDRELGRKKVEAEIEIARKKAEAQTAQADADRARANAGLIEAERRRQLALPRWQRRDVAPVTAPTAQPTVEAPAISALPTPEAKAPAAARLTVEQVKERWWWYLTVLAFAECFASILAGSVLLSIWEWDRNKDGIADHLKDEVKFPHSLDVGK